MIKESQLIEVGFTPEKDNKYFKVELDAKGFVLRYSENLKDYVVEPIFRPTSRIVVNSFQKLEVLYNVITDKYLKP